MESIFWNSDQNFETTTETQFKLWFQNLCILQALCILWSTLRVPFCDLNFDLGSVDCFDYLFCMKTLFQSILLLDLNHSLNVWLTATRLLNADVAMFWFWWLCAVHCSVGRWWSKWSWSVSVILAERDHPAVSSNCNVEPVACFYWSSAEAGSEASGFMFLLCMIVSSTPFSSSNLKH